MEENKHFIIYPAVDIRQGKVVRLIEGDPARQTMYGDPFAAARRWIEAGTEWLHVVNLDGAFGNEGDENPQTIKGLLQLFGKDVKIQVGGGLRSIQDIEELLSGGARRVVLGTIAVENPDTAEKALQTFGPEHIALALDARDGKILVSGWAGETDILPEALGKEFRQRGLTTAIYTDIRRDGGGAGVNIEASRKLAESTKLEIIASGGAKSLEDVRKAKAAGLGGIILGRALYAGSIDLGEALQC
ncbi:MAG: 1-(5-phosphoribosyl)-5-[(5-phosphoribosylamino)methylideneamino]imidazole-4-carboxamide isomerase [Chloroflexi bacterium]|nr:MAG: 1-(5-phosphoribosyl)-5-[(5-phosphoribosylamino)methylideneamino]imidazole-4-carboxamide isomerase [Chloroflexota bacterium]